MAAVLKPRLRGVLHQYAFFAALAGGLVLVLSASTTLAALASGIYATALAGLFGVSALYHRVTWAPPARRRMRRLDHSMIFLLIAGTYTPMALLVLPPSTSTVLLAVVWGLALAGVALSLVWIGAPRGLTAALYVLLGWVVLGILPDMVSRLGVATLVLLALGGVSYTAGAAIYAVKRPNPVPRIFGYHEVFHALTIGAAALHFAAVASVVR